MSTTRRILVFAKAPIEGQVKTRLSPHLSPRACADLQRNLSLHTLHSACESQLAPVELWCTPNTSHPFLCDCAERFDIPQRLQRGADLGERMLHALSHSLRNDKQALLIGTDCPAINRAYLSTAFDTLQRGNDVVLGPAEDGGYVLIGVRRVAAALFCEIDWGTARVLEQTRAALRRLEWSWTELEPLWDVDRTDDISRLRAHPRLARVLPETHEFRL